MVWIADAEGWKMIDEIKVGIGIGIGGWGIYRLFDHGLEGNL